MLPLVDRALLSSYVGIYCVDQVDLQVFVGHILWQAIPYK